MKSFTTLVVVALFGLGLNGYSFAAESMPHQHNHNHAATDQSAVYHCPMHPEETGHKGDSCSICGMKMVPAKTQDKTGQHYMQMKESFATPEIAATHEI